MDKKLEEGWLETVSGKKYYVHEPRYWDISIKDIAHALSMQCRYNGHTKEFYSVAEHSVLVAQYIHNRYRSWGGARLSMTALLHDAHEAFIGDLVSPMKPFLEDYKALEEIAMEAVAERFNLIYPHPYVVKCADMRILLDEREQAMNPSDNDWGISPYTQPLGVDIEFLPPRLARKKFLTYYYALAKLRAKGF